MTNAKVDPKKPEPPAPLEPYEKIENTLRLGLLFFFSLLFWSVLGVHLSYHPVLVFGMIGLYNEQLRDYWSILANESVEWGIWPGLLSVLKSEILWILTITLSMTLIFWAVRRLLFRTGEPLSEVIAMFIGEQFLAFLVAAVAATVGAILVGTSFIFGLVFQTPVSLQIANIIEIVASALLIFSLFLALVFWFIDLETRVGKAAEVALGLFLLALPLSGIGLWWASHNFSLEMHLEAAQPLPKDFLLYSEDSANDLKVPEGAGDDISLFDQVSKPGQTIVSSTQDGEKFWWRINSDNYHRDSAGEIMVWRSIYITGEDIVPDWMPAFFHKRPNDIEIDWEDRKIYLSYTLDLQRVPSLAQNHPQNTKAPQNWTRLTGNWKSRSVSGPANGDWGLKIQNQKEAGERDEVRSYSVFAGNPLRLKIEMLSGKSFEMDLPYTEPVTSLMWHRQTYASLWVNGTPAFYFLIPEPTQVEALGEQALNLSQRDFQNSN